MKHLFANHDLTTGTSGEMIDITDDVLETLASSGVTNGIAVVYSPHTTCAIVVNENEAGFRADFERVLEELAPSGGCYYRHDDLEVMTEGLEPDTADFPNGHSHVRAGLLASSSQTIPVVQGRLMLGPWQRVFFCELDRSRPRKVYLQIMGD